jgi:hypothetical protein
MVKKTGAGIAAAQRFGAGKIIDPIPIVSRLMMGKPI